MEGEVVATVLVAEVTAEDTVSVVAAITWEAALVEAATILEVADSAAAPTILAARSVVDLTISVLPSSAITAHRRVAGTLFRTLGHRHAISTAAMWAARLVEIIRRCNSLRFQPATTAAIWRPTIMGTARLVQRIAD